MTLLTWESCLGAARCWGSSERDKASSRAGPESAQGGCVALAVSLGEVIVFFFSSAHGFFCPVQSSVSIGFKKPKSMVLFSEF